jgi:hypothetical protein
MPSSDVPSSDVPSSGAKPPGWLTSFAIGIPKYPAQADRLDPAATI